ncbi:MAG: mucoidy inhibitor MuiA family protein [Planctomycetota bacterium]|jgi:uncharacterized protein (TIGR02231 family)
MSTAAKLCVVLLLTTLVAVAPTILTAGPQDVPGTVTEVTLYRGQAMVTRTIPLEGPAGGVEIVVGDLPEQVVSDSLFAEGGEGIEVRAVRFRTRAVGQAPREEVRRLDEAIEQINEKVEGNKKLMGLLAKRTAYLDQLEGFVAPTAKLELSKGVLDAEALQTVTTFSFDQRKAVAEEELALEKDGKDLSKQLALLQRQRAELTGGASQTVREAVLFLQKHVEGKESVRLNYLVGNCGWSPTYTVRADNDRKQVDVECSALIQQMTGEDWDGVVLTLSTASPALSAAGPGLAPFPVSLAQQPGEGKLSQKDLTAQVQSIRGRKATAMMQNLKALSLGENIGSSWAANAAANEFQRLELINGKDVLSLLAAENAQSDEGPSLSYQLSGTASLASRSDQQMVRILQTSFESRFYHVATPVLTSYIYRESEMKNDSDQDLLAGPITVYLDGRFVGRGEIPTVARGQTFVVGFGADPQLRSRRELAERTEDVQGGNRELGFEYRLVVENYKDEEVPVRVFDRLPHTDRPGDIRVKLGELKDPLSSNELYVRTEKPKGILRWEITVPAAATGKDARIIAYGFTVDFDRNFSLASATDSPQQLQQEFEQQQRARFAH